MSKDLKKVVSPLEDGVFIPLFLGEKNKERLKNLGECLIRNKIKEFEVSNIRDYGKMDDRDIKFQNIMFAADGMNYALELEYDDKMDGNTLVVNTRNHHIHLLDIRNGRNDTTIFRLYVVDLQILPNKNDGSKIWEWLFFFKNAQNKKYNIHKIRNPFIKEAYNDLLLLSQDIENSKNIEISKRIIIKC